MAGLRTHVAGDLNHKCRSLQTPEISTGLDPDCSKFCCIWIGSGL